MCLQSWRGYIHSLWRVEQGRIRAKIFGTANPNICPNEKYKYNTNILFKDKVFMEVIEQITMLTKLNDIIHSCCP